MGAEGPLPSRGSLVARNTLLNLLGQLLPLAVGVAAIPIIVPALGEERFGLLGLMWAVLGYFSVLDLGLGRATTKFVAQYLAQGDERSLRRVATLAVASQTAIGVLAGIALAAMVPLVIENVLHVPAALHGEARSSFLLLALSVPFVVLSLSLRAILEAIQRFDLVNFIRTPSSVAVFLAPAIAAPLGVRLPGILLLLLLVRVITCWVTWIAVRRTAPWFRWELAPSWHALRPLLSYGGWVSVSNVVSPILTYLERFMLGSLAGLAAVAYYTAPYEGVTRLLIVPASLATALFPALSASGSHAWNGDARRLLAGSVRYLLLALAVPIALFMTFPTELLQTWLGPAFAARSADVVRILSVGVLVNGLAHLPFVYLLGQGRPDVVARFHLVELFLYAVGAWWLVGSLGVTGAALAWTLRVTLDAALLFAATWRLGGVTPRVLLSDGGGRALGSVAVVVLSGIGIGSLRGLGLDVRVALATGAVTAYGIYVWRVALTDVERTGLRRSLARLGVGVRS